MVTAEKSKDFRDEHTMHGILRNCKLIKSNKTTNTNTKTTYLILEEGEIEHLLIRKRSAYLVGAYFYFSLKLSISYIGLTITKDSYKEKKKNK